MEKERNYKNLRQLFSVRKLSTLVAIKVNEDVTLL